jgi:hypothetical protein
VADRGGLPPLAKWGSVALAVVAALGMIALLSRAEEPPAALAAGKDGGFAAHALGRLGQAVTAIGQVVSVDTTQNILVVRVADGSLLALAFAEPAPLEGLAQGRQVQVKGIIVRIEGPQALVLEGQSVAPAAP